MRFSGPGESSWKPLISHQVIAELIAVTTTKAGLTDGSHVWFNAEPWRTSREFLERLQAEYPGAYPNQLLRTL